MTTFDLRFVDAVSATANVRLDLMQSPWAVQSGTRFDPPELQRAVQSTLLLDGDRYPASAYGNRFITLVAKINAADEDATAAALQALMRELDRPTNILEYRPWTTSPVFFRTFRAGPNDVVFNSETKEVTCTIPARPFAEGLRESTTVTVNNNPAHASNGMFFDLDSVKGDVETPLILKVVNASLTAVETLTYVSAIATRRGGTPSSAPRVLQCESMTLGTDTTLPGNDATMSGSGSNYARTSFATATAMTRRVGATFPAAAGTDVRGVYRAYVRWRRSVAGDTIDLRLRKGDLETNSGVTYNDTVRLPASTAGAGLADLGEVAYPAGPDPIYDATGALIPVGGYGLAIEAQRVSGSGNLDLDYILLVPADDATGYAQWSGESSHTYQVIDGVARAAYVLGSSGQVDRPVSMRWTGGGWPYVTPGQSNRVHFVLNASSMTQYAALGVPDSISSATQIEVSYMPHYQHVRPVGS